MSGLLLLVACAQVIYLDGAPLPDADTGAADSGVVDTGPDDPCAEVEVVPFEVSFPAREPDCPWGQGDNVWLTDGEVSARVEEEVAIELGGAVICDAALVFPAQGLPYDDAFLLTFGGVVLVASEAHMVEALEAEGIWRLYDWTRLLGLPLDFVDPDSYCLGVDDGLATCSVPAAESGGDLALSLDPAIVAALATRGDPTFGLVTLGDNDDDEDCSHGALSFSLDVTVGR